MAAPNAKYGLFIPKKTAKGTMLTQATKRNVFGDDSDEESNNIPISGTSKKVTTGLAKVKKQTQLEIDKAILEDPTVYEYDAVYDNMQAEKIKSDVKEKNKQDKKPKYITNLLKMAEVRKREEERRTERKVQKEREEEGNQFADKEAFVTSAYKKKMIEQQEAEERERKEAALEAMLDVTKQKDLSGFYRYLYRETTGKETDEDKPELKVKLESKSDEESDDSTDSLVQREQLRKSSHGRDREHKKDREQDRDKYTREDRSRRGRSRSRSPAQRVSKSDRSTYESKSDNRMSKSQSRRGSKSRSPQKSRPARDKRQSRSQDRRQRASRSPDGRQRTRSKDRKSRRSRSRENEKEKGSKEEKKKSASMAKLPREDPGADGESDRPTNFSSSKDKLVRTTSPLEDLDRDDSLSESDYSEDEAAVPEETSSRSERKQTSREKNTDGEKAQIEKTGESKGEKSELKYARHTSDEGVSDARKRFLARKLARERATAVDAE